ncbi:MAG TPA: carboxyl transferase domain-containing protein [Microbacteriaceae bacterium]|nr:carboxyl transferase domain-containing protein [Microbacteriaceae bacterium]
MSEHLGARALLELICEDGSFTSWDEPFEPWPRSEAYEAELAAARARSGVDESVRSGEGLVGPHRVAFVASEFAFLGGSIGRDAAARLIGAIERATRERLPLLAGPASGGTRLQEGTAAFVAMAGISAAIARHKAAGLPYLVYLRHPTTGGVMSSWGSLGHVTVAEPGALLGFLGPRALEALTGERLADGVQSAENLYAHGLVDAIVPPRTLPRIVHRALDVLMAPRPAAPTTPLESPRQAPVAAADAVARSRDPRRPGLRALLATAPTDVLTLNGTGRGEADRGLLLALAKFGDAACVVIGHDRREGQPGRPFGPAALRQLQRGVRLSSDLGLPLVSIIDTPGAQLSREAEEGGLPGEIARSLADLMQLASPTVSVLLGPGTGGGALASLPADRVLCARNSWLAPLPPEGAAAILWRDPSRASEMADSLGMTATDLFAAGIVDAIIPEFDNAADEPIAFCRRTGAIIADALGELAAMTYDERLGRRVARYR